MRKAFQDIPFRDREAAERVLEAMLEAERPDLAEHFAAALREAADPSRTLDRLERLLGAVISPAQLLELMASAPQFCQMIVTLLSQSQFLSDIVFRNPEYLTWLWSEAELREAVPREVMRDQLLRQMQAFDAFDKRLLSMRRFHRREILRIGARDVFIHAHVASVTEDLSNLADAMIEAGLKAAEDSLRPRYGEPKTEDGRPATFVALGMGKLGGRELNFSSDIDPLFLYSEEGETTGGASGRIGNSQYFSKLGELLIQSLATPTAEGYAYRVDMRLRPHGRRGPLVCTVDAATDYYGHFGQAWERQALIKARPVGGDFALGEEFIARTRPFVFPRYFDDETLEEIRGVKLQMEAQIRARGETDIEVKLGKGGIRDIEFTVQMLQMLNGGRQPELRTNNTLEAIRQLGACAILRAFEATALASNYAFLRQVEHRLQIEGSQQLHALPAEPAELEDFARRLGFFSAESFMREYRMRAEETREILERFLETEGAGNLWVRDLLNAQSDGATSLPRLAQLGFADPAAAREQLLALLTGPAEAPHTMHIRQQFYAMAPALLKALSRCGDPNAALVRLSHVLARIQAPSMLYHLFQTSPIVIDYLAALVSNSEHLTEILLRDPGLFDAFGSAEALAEPSSRERLERSLESYAGAYQSEAAPYRLHDAETLRVGMRELFCGIDVFQVGEELTLLAEVCLAHILREARAQTAERFGETQARFAVLALGKFGGAEMGYGSDLDLVFAYEPGVEMPGGMAASEYFAAVASQTLKRLKEPTRFGLLYDIDARLRPDGKKGVLAVSVERLEQYYDEEAQVWERLALTKVRAVGGDREFAEGAAARARAHAFRAPLSAEELDQVDDMRQRLQAEAGPFDLKKREGGIVEIEFALRLLQIRHAQRLPELRRGDALGALKALEAAKVLSHEAAAVLLEAYVLFRRVENRIRMAHGRSGICLPDAPEARDDLARRLGVEDDLLELIETRRRAVHAIYLDVLRAVRLA